VLGEKEWREKRGRVGGGGGGEGERGEGGDCLKLCFHNLHGTGYEGSKHAGATTGNKCFDELRINMWGLLLLRLLRLLLLLHPRLLLLLLLLMLLLLQITHHRPQFHCSTS